MTAELVGIDIGDSTVNIASYRQGATRLVVRRMPENMMDDGRIVSPESLSAFLSQVKREEHITASRVALVLPSSSTFFRHINIPVMTEDQLKLNLPYEFHDFITGDSDSYFYDYVVAGTTYEEDEGMTGFELYAAAAPKSVITEYSEVLKKAGFKLKLALPRQMALSGVIGRHIAKNPTDVDHEFCIVDIRYAQTVIDIFLGDRHQASKTADIGCGDIDLAVADLRNVDTYLAGTYRESDFESVLESPDAEDVYSRIAIEVVKAINFYRFDKPENNLHEMFLCGSGAPIAHLRGVIASQTGLEIHGIAELFPQDAAVIADQPSCAMALAMALAE